MNRPILIVVVFCIILFFYLHIQFQFKTSNDLELFEIYETTKEGMEEICNMRQPTVFNHVDDQLVNAAIKKINIDALNERYPQYSVQVREENGEEYASLPLTAATQLMAASSFTSSSSATLRNGTLLNKCFYSENNRDFLAETGALKNISDRMLRPSLCSRTETDVLFGTEGCTTPLRFDLNYRNYYLCTKGIVYIKLVPPKYTSKLDAIYDYDLFEFRTPHNMWTNNSNADVKSLEIALTPGKILFIPAYWWHSFQFGPHTSVMSFKYRTYMNTVATVRHSLMYFLQQHNIRKKFVKPAPQKKKKEDNDDLLFAQKRPAEIDTIISPDVKDLPIDTIISPEINQETSSKPNITHTVDEIPIDEIPIDEIPIDEIPIDEIPIDEKADESIAANKDVMDEKKEEGNQNVANHMMDSTEEKDDDLD